MWIDFTLINLEGKMKRNQYHFSIIQSDTIYIQFVVLNRKNAHHFDHTTVVFGGERGLLTLQILQSVKNGVCIPFLLLKKYVCKTIVSSSMNLQFNALMKCKQN